LFNNPYHAKYPIKSLGVMHKGIGAGTGTQTLGLFLGKEALYQLSYTRIWWRLLDLNQRHEALQATALPLS
jgi:hypothetical protein